MPGLLGTLIITSAEDPKRVLTIENLDRDQPVIHIGCDPENDVLLTINGVQKKHAIVHYDHQDGLWVDNLSDFPAKYKNGLERSFPPGKRVPLPQSARLTIGPITLEVRLTPIALQAAPPATDEEAPLAIRLPDNNNDSFAVTPGVPLVIPVHVTNRSRETRSVLCQVRNLPAGWSWRTEPKDLALDSLTSPTERHSGIINVLIEVPRHADSTTPEDNVEIETISAASETVKGFSESQSLSLTVLPFVAFAARMRPERARGWRGGRFRLVVNNQSNVDLPLDLRLDDTEEALRWDYIERRPWRRWRSVTSVPLLAPRGQEVEWTIVSRPRRLRLLGRPRTFAFTATIVPDLETERLQDARVEVAGLQPLQDLGRRQDQAVMPRELKGELIHSPLPWWVPLVLLALLVVLLLVRFPQLPQTIVHRLERRPTTLLQQGPITLTFEGFVTPAETRALSFARDGRIVFTIDGCDLNAAEPCPVTGGAVVARLDPGEANEAVAAAERDLAQARAAGQQASEQQGRDEAEAFQKLKLAEAALGRLISGGRDDLFAAADAEQRATERALQQATDQADALVQASQAALEAARRALDEAERQYAIAVEQARWVRERGTHPTETIPDPNNANKNEDAPPVPRPLNPLEKELFYEREATAERVRQDKEREHILAHEAAQRARTAAVSLKDNAQERLAQVQRRREQLYASCSTFERIGDVDVGLTEARLEEKLATCTDERLRAAYSALLSARYAYQTVEARGKGAEAAAEAAIADAQAAVRRATARVAAGEIVAPGNGRVLLLQPIDAEVRTGQAVATFIPDDTQLELAAPLAAEQVSLLRQGTTVSFAILGADPSPDCSQHLSGCYKAVIDRLPGPLPGTTAPPELIARFRISDSCALKGLSLQSRVAIHAPLGAAPETAYWLPVGWVAEDPSGVTITARRDWLDYTVPVIVLARDDDQIQILARPSTEDRPTPPASESDHATTPSTNESRGSSWLSSAWQAMTRPFTWLMDPAIRQPVTTAVIGSADPIPLKQGLRIVAP